MAGVWALGCQLVCANPDCTELAVVEGRTQVKLNRSTISGSGSGVFASCGAEVAIQKSTVANNGSGALVSSTYWFDESHYSSVASSFDAHETIFAGNTNWGVISYDSWLMLGSIDDPGRNSFLSNSPGSIANVSSNPVLAQWNWFGTANAVAIASTIGGDVTYEPFLRRAP